MGAVRNSGTAVTGSNMRPWRGGLFSHLRYARHVSIARTLHSNCSRSELYCSFFSQSVSQLLLQSLLQPPLQPPLQSLQFRDLSANQSSNRLITTAIITATAPFQRSLSQPINQSINQGLPRLSRIKACCQQISGWRSTHFWTCCQQISRLLPAYLSLESNAFLILTPVCQQLSR